MDIKQLETIICEEISRRLKELEGPRNSAPSNLKPPVVIISEAFGEMRPPGTEIIESLSRDFPCRVLLPGCRDEPPSFLKGLQRWDSGADLASPDFRETAIGCVLIFAPSLAILSALALGFARDPALSLILKSLLSGVPVFCFPDMPILVPGEALSGQTLIAGRQAAGILALYEQYRRVLEKWGIVWTGEGRLYDSVHQALERADEGGTAPSRAAGPNSRRPVITGDDVREHILGGRSELTIPDNAIVTDIAREICDREGLRLIPQRRAGEKKPMV